MRMSFCSKYGDHPHKYNATVYTYFLHLNFINISHWPFAVENNFFIHWMNDCMKKVLSTANGEWLISTKSWHINRRIQCSNIFRKIVTIVRTQWQSCIIAEYESIFFCLPEIDEETLSSLWSKVSYRRSLWSYRNDKANIDVKISAPMVVLNIKLKGKGAVKSLPIMISVLFMYNKNNKYRWMVT